MPRRHTAPSTRRNASLVSTSSCIRHCTSHHTHNVVPSLKCRQIIWAKQLLKVAAHYSTTATYRLVTKMQPHVDFWKPNLKQILSFIFIRNQHTTSIYFYDHIPSQVPFNNDFTQKFIFSNPSGTTFFIKNPLKGPFTGAFWQKIQWVSQLRPSSGFRS